MPIRAMAIAAVLAVLAVGCGGDDEGEVTSAAVTDDESAETTSDATTGDDSAGDATTGDADDDGTDDAGGDDQAMTGDGGSEWCQRIREAQESGEDNPLDLGLTNLDPASVEEFFTENLALMDEWRDAAPPEIDDQVETMYGAYQTFVERAEEAEWNLLVLGADPELLEIIEDPAIEQAADDIDAYSRDVCGVDFAAGAAATPTAPTGGDVDATLAAGVLEALGLPTDGLSADQAVCMSDELAAAFPDGPPSGPGFSTDQSAALGVAMAVCGFTGG
jgi:hypothetical protein